MKKSSNGSRVSSLVERYCLAMVEARVLSDLKYYQNIQDEELAVFLSRINGK
jgi:hypothetical protein